MALNFLPIAEVINLPTPIGDPVAIKTMSGETITLYPSEIGAVVDIFDPVENTTIDTLMTPAQLRQLARAAIASAEFAERFVRVKRIEIEGVVS